MLVHINASLGILVIYLEQVMVVARERGSWEGAAGCHGLCPDWKTFDLG